MAITGTYKQKTSPKIWKFFQFGADSGLPPPFSYTSEFGKRSVISEYRREIKNFSSNLTIGGMNITTLDFGSIFATHLDGSHFTGQQISIYAQSPVQEGYMKIFNGFVGNTQYADGILQFSVTDKYYNVKDAKLEFDYKKITHNLYGYDWGTVINVLGSCVYFRLPDPSLYSDYFHRVGRNVLHGGDPYGNYSKVGDGGNIFIGQFPSSADKVRTIFRNLGSYDNYITEANFAKFTPPDTEYSGNYNDSSEFDAIKVYKVSGQLNAKDENDSQYYWGGVAVKEGTLEIEGNIRGIKSGYRIYIRQPLYLCGNPVQIIGSLARGDYNTLPEVLGTIPLDTESFATLSVYCQQMNAIKEFTDSSKGDVANVIQQLAEESFIDVWMDKNGTMHFSAIKPYGNNISTEGSFYNDQNAWGFKYSDAMDDVAYKITAKYGIRSYPDYQTYDLIEKERETSKLAYSNKAIILEKDFEFYHDEDEVVTFISRELFWRRHGVVRWEWESPLFGLDMELGSYTCIRNEIFPTGSHIVYCDSIGINLNENLIKFTGWDYTNCFLNTYILTWQGDAISNPTTITGTSNSGWSILDPEMIGSTMVGTVYATNTGSIATIILYHTNKSYYYIYADNLLATTGYYFKKLRLIDETYNGLWWGTFVYRYHRLWGNAELENSVDSGVPVPLFAVGEGDDEVYRAGLPIPALKNEYGESIGGTVQNLTSPYGTSSIFW